MARKSITITIDAPGRDFGRAYKITEMPAAQAEEWAARAFLAMARSGVEVPDSIASSGLAGVAAMGLRGLRGVKWEDAEPLMRDMMACVQAVPDPTRPQITRGLVETDIEEVKTRFQLRVETMKLHVDFSVGAGPSTSAPAPETTGESS